MLPAGLLAKAVQLCAAGLGATASHAPSTYSIVIHDGTALLRRPSGEAEAIAAVHDLVALGADFDAGPLAIRGQDFSRYRVTPASVFDPCALARVDATTEDASGAGPASISSVTALVRRVFNARVTDTIRPMNASYGARFSWHKVGQAIDFVPAAGVNSITREQVRAVMAASGVRLIELLGPGDHGHSNHWHIAFARPGQVTDRVRTIEGDEDWMVDVASTKPRPLPSDGADPTPAAASPPQTAEKAPPTWDVFAAAAWRTAHGGAS